MAANVPLQFQADKFSDSSNSFQNDYKTIERLINKSDNPVKKRVW